MDRREQMFGWLIGGLSIIMLALVGWQVMQGDFSQRQTEHRRKFGAVYMTLNNPFYEIVDEEIRMTVVHEIAHYFGMDEDQVDEMGYA